MLLLCSSHLSTRLSSRSRKSRGSYRSRRSTVTTRARRSLFTRLSLNTMKIVLIQLRSSFEIEGRCCIYNAAAILITGPKRKDHISPVSVSLHWLYISFIIDFNIIILTLKTLNGLPPKYISDPLTSYVPLCLLMEPCWSLLSISSDRG